MKSEKKAAKKMRVKKAQGSAPPAENGAKPKIGEAVVSGTAEVPAQKPVKLVGSQLGPDGQGDALLIPPILLEGDADVVPALTGPGERYVLGPVASSPHWSRTRGQSDLPESYGTGRLFLTARDPRWLHVAWDLAAEQQRQYNALSCDGHLIVRVYQNSLEEPPLQEVPVQADSRSWFVQVGRGGVTYVSELGYRDQRGEWMRIAISPAVLTPPDGVSEDTAVQFADIPPEASFKELLEIILIAVGEDVPIAEAVQQLRSHGPAALPPVPPSQEPRRWTPSQVQALAEALGLDAVPRRGMGSLEMAESIRQHLRQEVPSPAAALPTFPKQPEQPGAPAGAVSSAVEAFGAPERERPFWFNVNAELVVYGATEPDAQVGIGGRRIKLRPDGTFSFRFALPDGNYDLKVLAVSADGEEARLAELRFARSTAYTGNVGVHPQDPNLKIPAAVNVG